MIKKWPVTCGIGVVHEVCGMEGIEIIGVGIFISVLDNFLICAGANLFQTPICGNALAWI